MVHSDYNVLGAVFNFQYLLTYFLPQKWKMPNISSVNGQLTKNDNILYLPDAGCFSTC